MQNVIEGQVTLTFIRGGMSKKGSPYLQVSNGRSEFFVNVPKDFDPQVFEQYDENDDITLEVSVMVGSETVKLLSVL